MSNIIRLSVASIVCVVISLVENTLRAEKPDAKQRISGSAVSPNGKWFVVGFENDEIVKVWNLDKMEVVHSLQLPDLYMASMLLSDDGNELILAHRDIQNWDLKKQKMTAFFTIDRLTKVACVGLHREQGSIIATCADGIRKLDEKTLKCDKEFADSDCWRCSSIHGLSKDTAVLTSQRSVAILDLTNGKSVKEYTINDDPMVLLKCQMKDKPYIALLTSGDHLMVIDEKGRAVIRKTPHDAEDMFYSTFTKSLYIIAKDGFLSTFDPIENKTEKKMNLKGTGLCIAMDRHVDRILPIMDEKKKGFRFIDLKDYSFVPIKK